MHIKFSEPSAVSRAIERKEKDAKKLVGNDAAVGNSKVRAKIGTVTRTALKSSAEAAINRAVPVTKPKRKERAQTSAARVTDALTADNLKGPSRMDTDPFFDPVPSTSTDPAFCCKNRIILRK